MMNLIKPLHDMPVVELTPQFIAGMRDRIAMMHGRRQANYVMAVVSWPANTAKNTASSRTTQSKGLSACGGIGAYQPRIVLGLKRSVGQF